MRREPFVLDFVDTPLGPVPRVAARLGVRDLAGAALARLGLNRDRYRIVPGLYCVGEPDPVSPVLVTANYKLSFDALRKELRDVDAWVLVVDTHGINVWCAAGKGTFSTEEVAHWVRASGLEQVVSHRELVLPQLAATGVAAHRLRRLCGFSGRFGPVAARHLPEYLGLADRKNPPEAMRRVTFALKERAVLAPVEVVLLWKTLLAMALGVLLLSGLGPHVFSFVSGWARGGWGLAATAAGVLAGTVAVPLLLPWLPGRAFSLKGAWLGVVAGTAVGWASGLGLAAGAGLCLWATALASYLGMNFTGSTPFTSPSGVEREMRRAIPVQAGAAVLAAGLWLYSGFMG